MDTTKRLLEIINFDYPPLLEAKKCLEKGDEKGCVERVINHFRTRKDPVYLFNKDTANFSRDPEIIEEAEKTMNHYIFSHQFDGDIDFTFNPTEETSRDNEWTWSLYRTIYFQPLARAYAITKDEKYVKEFAKDIKEFYYAWPAEEHIKNLTLEMKTPFPGHAWRTIETAMRIYTTWLPCMEIFRSSPSFDIETWIVFLCSVHDHGEFLLHHFSNHAKSSNWLSMECSALLQMGIMFPEFKDAEEWKNTAYKRVMHEIAYSFDEDGIHMERTPIYHMVASIAFTMAIELCKLNGIYVPRYAEEKMERAADFILRITKPDFSTPMLGDADRNDFLTPRADKSLYEGMNLTFFPEDRNEIRAYFNWMYKITGRKDFLFVATGGKEGEKPQINDSKFSDGGIYVFRTGWGDEDYLMTQMIKLESGEISSHSHSDAGHIELMLGGEDILIDCGRYIYNSSIWKDWRHYFLSGMAHNVFSCDDHYNGAIDEYPKRRGLRGLCHKYESTPLYKLCDISHNGFCYLADAVFPRRAMVMLPQEKALVVFDSVEGMGKEDHDMTISWNFASTAVEKNGEEYIYTTPKNNKYSFNYFTEDKGWESKLLRGSLNPKGGWVSYGYPVKEPIGEVVVEKRGKVPFLMISIIKKEESKVDVSFLSDGATVKLGERTINYNKNGVSVL